MKIGAAFLGLSLLWLASFFSCLGETPGGGKGADFTAPRRGASLRELLEQYMPEQMADGAVKVAIVRNLAVGDHTRQFLDGCIAEGRAMGFTVDTFITGGDNLRCRELIAGITRADYDGLIFSHGEGGSTWDFLKPAVDQGIKVVTFDALPYKNGDPAGEILPGVTSTAQEDEKLARISLEALLSRFGESRRPVRVIRATMGGILPLDRRQIVYDEFARAGRIEEVALLRCRDIAFARREMAEALPAALSRLPPGSVDAIWAPYDEFAKGCLDALKETGREDIKLVSIDISNDDITLMLSQSALWVATAAVDPRLIGIVNMRLLAAKFAGEPTPEVYSFDAQIVETALLNNQTNMANIGTVIPGWGREQGHFDQYPWMAELKTAGKYLRFPPVKNGKNRREGQGAP